MTAARDALVRWNLRAMLDVFHQQVKGVLRVRLDQLEQPPVRGSADAGLGAAAIVYAG